MSKIRLAAILIVIATVLVAARNYFAKDDPLVPTYALCMDMSADKTSVIDACSEVLQVDWLSVETRSSLLKNRANAHRRLGEFDEAFADIDQVLALKPDDANAFQWRSQIYLNLEDFERAEFEYRKARSLAPKDTALINWWLRWMSGSDRQEQVLAACEQLVLVDPEINSGSSCKIKPLLKLGRTDEAVTLLKQLSETLPDDEKTGTYFYLGQVYLHLNYGKAETLAVFEKWMETGEVQPLPSLFLAATHLKFGDKAAGACHINDVVLHMSQGLPDGWVTLKGKVARALEPLVYRGAGKHYYAGLAYSMIREYEQARHEYDLFLREGGPNAKALLVKIIVEEEFASSAEDANADQRVFDRGLERYMVHNGRHFTLEALLK